MAVYDFKKIVSESYRVLIVTVLIGLVSGYMLDIYSGKLTAVILAMVPPINGIGGNIGSVLGARLSSALHLGTVTPDFRENKPLKINLTASISSGLIIYGIIGVFFFVSSLLSYAILRSARLMMVFFGAGVLLICVIVLTSVFSAFISYRRGVDPDNVVIPVVTTVVDVAGVGSLILMVNIFGLA